MLIIGVVVFYLIVGQTKPAIPGAASVALVPTSQIPPPASHVGVQTCASCHSKEYEAWKDSQHHLSMQSASNSSVLAGFNGERFTEGGVTSTFFKRDGKFMVRTDGPDGKLRDYEITHTFGVYPLQQYLIPLDNGRMQALSIAWDTRPKEQGGQRWFHLYAGQNIKAGDPLHWTGLLQNWNFMCADCHSTNLKKNYDPQLKRFSTSWSEMSVSCEACHGPGSNHVSWARKELGWQHLNGGGKGLAIALDERKGASWTISPDSGNAVRSTPRESVREVEMCARCHALSSKLTDDYVYGKPIADTHRIGLLDDNLYWSDGQMRGEVYNYGPFIQSKMFHKGVTCSDCHDPHTQKLRAPGNEVCFQCHAPSKYETQQHHFHPLNSKGASCAACHMPTTTYMVIDPRHDHSIRIPRPEQSVRLGTPNACTNCHNDKSAQWAAEQTRKWYPHPIAGYQQFAEALHAGSTGAPGALDQLAVVAENKDQPGIARASAVARMARYLNQRAVDGIRLLLYDNDPLVRRAAVEALDNADPALRAQLLPGLLDDPVKSVRIEAARSLVAAERLNPAQRGRLAVVLDEYVTVQMFNADRPESHSNLGTLYAERGEFQKAEASFKTALELSPYFVAASVNLADVYRAQGRERDAETILRQALKTNPQSPDVHHALGLSLVRQHRMADALAELRKAATLGPQTARYRYVYAVALYGAGQRIQAIKELENALKQHPYDREMLVALVSYLRESGEDKRAAMYAARLAELEPGIQQTAH